VPRRLLFFIAGERSMQDNQVATRSFRLVLSHLWLTAGLAHLALLAAIVLAINLAGKVVDDSIWLPVMCIVAFAYWIAYGLRFRLTVSESGLGWINSSGAACFLSWSDIEKAERNKELGGLLPVLMVWSKKESGPFFIPFDVTNRDLLCETLQELAGEMHPVTVAIANRDSDATGHHTGKD
jgi:hypothetical protein